MKHRTHKGPEGGPSDGGGDPNAITIPAGRRILSLGLALCLLLAMVLVVPRPVTVMAAPSSAGDANDGVDFAALKYGNIYYGTYKHILQKRLNESEPTPILWRVMGSEDGSNLTLLSEYVLDDKKFKEDGSSNVYKTSDIQDFLSGEFMGSFSSAEQADNAMPPITVTTGKYTFGSETRDNSQQNGVHYPDELMGKKAYLLWGTSVADGAGWKENVFWTAGDDIQNEYALYRHAQGNDRAFNQAYRKDDEGKTSAKSYWLRSPYSAHSTRALYVYPDGEVDHNYVEIAHGVRPAFQLNPSSVIFTSEIKSAPIEDWETEADGTYYAAGGGREHFKLTIVNNTLTQPSLTGYTSGSSTVTVAPGGNINLTNSASTEHLVYKIVRNDSGTRKIVGYGTGDASTITINGVANVTNEDNLIPGGDYTLYVWAQKDGGYNSHEGSTPVYFKLNVDDTKPTVTRVSPNSSGVPIGTSSLSITFDKGMDRVVPGTVSLNPGATVTGGAWEGDNRTIIYDLDDLAYNTTYTVTITGFQDTSGNVMDPDSGNTFTTESAVATPTDLKVGNMDDNTVAEKEDYSKTIPVDYNGSLPLGYSASGLPDGLQINGDKISGRLDDGAAAGSPYTVTVTVSEQGGGSLTDSGSYILTVTAAPATATQLTLAPPVDLTVTEGQNFTRTFSVTYTGSDSLTYTIGGLPEGVTYSTTTGEITGPAAPGTAQDIPYDITVDVTDTNGNDANGSFNLTVLAANGGDPGPDPNPNTYSVTVQTDGYGSANANPNPAAEGEIVTLTATADTGYRFKEWQVISGNSAVIDKPRESTAAFQMPGNAVTVKAVFEHSGENPGGNDPTPEPSGNGSSGARSSSRHRSSGGGASTPPPKTVLPASSFTWDSEQTLSIDHDSITTLGLLTVQWDGRTLTRGEDYAVYQGSVIVRFGNDFIAVQSSGDHIVRVEFLNHYGETTVTVGGEPGLAGEVYDDQVVDTHNPNTGGLPDSDMGATDNPNTGDGRGIWLALLLGSFGTAALVFGPNTKIGQ